MDALIQEVLRGDAAAWKAFWTAIEPTLWAITGKWQLTGPLSTREDERRNMVVEVMERLRENEFDRLRSYVASSHGRGSSSFKAWLATVTARVAIDYVRAHPEYRDVRNGERAAGRWVQTTRFADDADADDAGRGARIEVGIDPIRLAIAGELLDRARELLDRGQLAALYLWLHGESHDEIAEKLRLSTSRDADRLVRAALKRLRDRYAIEESARAFSKRVEEPS